FRRTRLWRVFRFLGYGLSIELRSIIRSEDLTLRASAQAPPHHPMDVQFRITGALSRKARPPNPRLPKRQTSARLFSVYRVFFIVIR
ncbi:hypothetical protein QOM18_16945, partial [Serratia marcescens]|uniref:hypothetical protein n=1 Tax=Serratia marcescens TaxID=615 RepID=UPI0024C487DD